MLRKVMQWWFLMKKWICSLMMMVFELDINANGDEVKTVSTKLTTCSRNIEEVVLPKTGGSRR